MNLINIFITNNTSFFFINSGYQLATIFFVRKNHKGLGEYPQQAGDDTTLVASKASACQTT